MTNRGDPHSRSQFQLPRIIRCMREKYPVSGIRIESPSYYCLHAFFFTRPNRGFVWPRGCRAIPNGFTRPLMVTNPKRAFHLVQSMRLLTCADPSAQIQMTFYDSDCVLRPIRDLLGFLCF